MLADRLGGVVINADSMQVYRDLRILTARPTLEDEALAPHRLYGMRPAASPGSVAWWRTAALAELEAAWSAGRLPILCGGTGLYLRALTEGLADIPEPSAAVRMEARALLDEIGPAALHARLATIDPVSAARLHPSDAQRLARAWEVWHATGRGIAAWTAEPGMPPAPCRFVAIRLAPPREVLRDAIRDRFATMLEAGALQEVSALLAQSLSPELPAMRAHGVPELAAVLRGQSRLDQAAARAVLTQTRYTRRQATWFAHQRLADAADTIVIETRIADMTQQMERYTSKIMPFVMRAVDAPAWTA